MQVMQFYSQFSLSDNSSMDTEGALPGMVGYFLSVFTSNCMEFDLILFGVVHAWALVGFLMVVLREDTIFQLQELHVQWNWFL